jgi:hypothetical protein
MRFLSGADMLALFLGDGRMLVERVEDGEPQQHPQQGNRARDHERPAPVPHRCCPEHQPRRRRRAERRAHIVDAAGDAALLRGKPFGHYLQPAGVRRTLGKAQRPAQHCQPLPVDHQSMRHGQHAPQAGEDGEAGAQANAVEDVAHHRLHHDAGLEAIDHPAIFALADMQVLEHHRGGETQRVARQIIDDGAQHHHADDPPAQPARALPDAHRSLPFDASADTC